MDQSPIKLIVGLGNPGEQYMKTRHNAGFLFLNALCMQIAGKGKDSVLKADKNCFGRTSKIVIAGHEVRVLEPDTFMNLSVSRFWQPCSITRSTCLRCLLCMMS